MNTIVILFGFFAISFASNSGKIDGDLLHKIQTSPDGAFNIILSFENGSTTEILSKLTQSFEKSTKKAVRGQLVYETLKSHAESFQSSILEFLESYSNKLNKFEFKQLWITNQISIKGASKNLIFELEEFPTIGNIREDGKVYLIRDFDAKSVPKPVIEVEWGVEKIQADKIWNITRGAGVILASIDTGARGSHEALVGSYVGAENNGWYDAAYGEFEPNDVDNHGSHVTGTMVGDFGIGVAPDAQWMSCRGFTIDGVGFISMVVECGQFFLCPTKPDGSEPDCSKAPAVVSNSWGDNTAHDYFEGVINAWRAAGIIPVFACGNSGRENTCSSIVYPAENPNVIAVGATNPDDSRAGFSSIGPSIYGDLKPEIVAPGVGVRSAGKNADNHYMLMSGTSMASPHAAGLIGLLLSINPELTFEEIKDILEKSASKNTTSGGYYCDGLNDDEWPNYHFGHGRIDALAAFNELKRYMQ